MSGRKGLTLLIVALIYSQLILVVVGVVISIILSLLHAVRPLFVSSVAVAVVITISPVSIVSPITTPISISIRIRRAATALKLVITAPLGGRVEIGKGIAVYFEWPFCISRVCNWRCFCATEGAGEGLQVRDLAEEEGVARHERLLPVRRYQPGLWGGVAEGGEGEVQECEERGWK